MPEESNSQPFPIGKRPSDRSPHHRIDSVEEDISSLRERIAGVEALVKNVGVSVDGMQMAINLMRTDVSSSINSLQHGILGTFSRLFVAMIFVVVFSVAAISALVGSGMYFSGLGFELGSHTQKQELSR